ncbi:MAG: phosphoserine phosphatase SerB, partial [Betaproteobacteria bacterium]|nr:phosphoserine phosphatase SerB [Betaproteobacteria bacterium]
MATREGLDVNVLNLQRRWQDFGMMAFDMDSTLINIECLDEMAAYAGCGEQVAAITEAAMRGEIADYDESLRQRVQLLKGQSPELMQRLIREK